MIEAFIIIYMAICSGWAGGTLWGFNIFGKLKFMPEVLFTLPFAYVLYPLVGWWSLIALPWVYMWKQTGHANALPWGDGGHNVNRTNTLSPLVKWICRKLGIEYYSRGFAWVFMGVKGFLISLPVGGLGILGYPLGYELGKRTGKHLYSELLSGAFIGVNIVLFKAVL